MRLFVTLCSLLVLAAAKPQGGYNYGSGISGGGGGGGGFLGAPSHTQSVTNYGPLGALQSASVGSLVGSHSNYRSSSSSVGHFGGGSSSSSGGGSFNTGRSSSSGSFGGGFGGGAASPSIGFGSLSGYNAPAYQQHQEEQQRASFEAPIVHKQFISVAAPEDHESLEKSKHLVIGRPQRNYRVVFIKAPSSSNANVRLSAEYAPQEEKTVIYVLSKKDNALEVNDIATPAPTQPSKPEVFFIKYKTEAEAQHAQHQIQAEYDKIQGTSEHTDGGVAPSQSVVGILDGGAGVDGGDAGVGAASNDHFSANSGVGSGFTSGSVSNSGINYSSGGHVVGGGATGGFVHKSSTNSVYLPPTTK